MLKPNDAYLLGYYGMQNTGDDALLYATAWAARQYLNCNKLKVSVFDNNPYATVAEGLGPTYFRGHERLRHYHIAATSKRLIIGGGSVFHSARDIQLKRHLIGLANPKKSMAVGVSIGPFQNLDAERACQGFLNECGFVGVRDQQSYEIATSLAPKANVDLTFDLAPALLCQNLENKGIPRKGIAFNFCQLAINPFGDVDTRAEQKRVDRACELMLQLWQQTGEPMYLVDFNGHDKFGDHRVHQQILDRLPAEVSVTHVPYTRNPLKLLQQLYTFKALVGMRLHAMIFGYLTETPTLSLHYHNKCRAWSQQIGQPHHYQFEADDFAPEELTDTLSKILQYGAVQPVMEVSRAVERSLSNWSNRHDAYSIFRRNTPVQQA